jgi:hypothetical protein
MLIHTQPQQAPRPKTRNDPYAGLGSIFGKIYYDVGEGYIMRKYFTAILFVSICFLAACGRASQADSEIAVKNLSKDTGVGIGGFIDYADDDVLVFHGEFGLFVYDLKAEKITFSADLEKAIGTTNIQGSETGGAVIRVSADGSTVQLYNSDDPDVTYYIDTADGTYSVGKYKELEDYFEYGAFNGYEYIQFDDGTKGELSCNVESPVGTVGNLRYLRGDREWRLFENWKWAAE